MHNASQSISPVPTNAKDVHPGEQARQHLAEMEAAIGKLITATKKTLQMLSEAAMPYDDAFAKATLYKLTTAQREAAAIVALESPHDVFLQTQVWMENHAEFLALLQIGGNIHAAE